MNNYTARNFPYTITSCEEKENCNLFCVEAFNVPIESTVLIKFYDNGDMIEMHTQRYQGNPITFSVNKRYRYIEVVVWDYDLKPIGDIEVINL